jgi:hypothetical protein
MGTSPRMPRPQPSRVARLFVVLAWFAILGHLTQSTHHAAVAHELGADGHLHHACASHAAAAPCTPSDDERLEAGLPGGDQPDDDGEGEPCPLQKPCVDTGLGLHLAHGAWQPWAPSARAELVAACLTPPLDVLDLAPKQSPPHSS